MSPHDFVTPAVADRLIERGQRRDFRSGPVDELERRTTRDDHQVEWGTDELDAAFRGCESQFDVVGILIQGSEARVFDDLHKTKHEKNVPSGSRPDVFT
jgi:hypothetical protein